MTSVLTIVVQEVLAICLRESFRGEKKKISVFKEEERVDIEVGIA